MLDHKGIMIMNGNVGVTDFSA